MGILKKITICTFALAICLVMFAGCGDDSAVDDETANVPADIIEDAENQPDTEDSSTVPASVVYYNAEDGIDDVVISDEEAVGLMEEINTGLGILLPHEEGFPNYPDNYGGAYYNGQICVCLTENTREIRDTYRSLVSIPGALTFKDVSHPYNFLYDLMMEVSNEDNALLANSIAVNEKNNCVDVGISADTFDSIKEKILKVLDEDKIGAITFIKEAPAGISSEDIDDPFPDKELTQEEIDYIWLVENLDLEEHYGSDRSIIYTSFDGSNEYPATIYFSFTFGAKYNLHGWASDTSFWLGDLDIVNNKVTLTPNPELMDPDLAEPVDPDQCEKIVFDLVDGNKLAFNAELSSDDVEYDLVLVGPGQKAPDIDGMVFEPDIRQSMQYNFDGFE